MEEEQKEVNFMNLNVVETDFEVDHYNYSLLQDFNTLTGQYKGIVFQNPLTITLQGKKEPKLLKWMVNTTRPEVGTISLYSGTELVSTVKFNGYLVGYTENTGKSGMTCTLTIVFKSLTAHDVEFTAAARA